MRTKEEFEKIIKKEYPTAEQFFAAKLSTHCIDLMTEAYNLALKDASEAVTQHRVAIDSKHSTWRVDKQSILDLMIKI
jgi:hypothetical protein